MMKSKQISIIDVVRAAYSIERVGRDPGITSIAKLVGISRPRCLRLVKIAVKEGMLYTYANRYNGQFVRCCYAPTPGGAMVLDILKEHKKKYGMFNNG